MSDDRVMRCGLLSDTPLHTVLLCTSDTVTCIRSPLQRERGASMHRSLQRYEVGAPHNERFKDMRSAPHHGASKTRIIHSVTVTMTASKSMIYTSSTSYRGGGAPKGGSTGRWWSRSDASQ